MSITDVREQSIYFQMQSVNQSDLPTNDEVVGEPATEESFYKFPHGTMKETHSATQHKNASCQSDVMVTKRLVFWLKTAVVLAFLVAVAALVLAVITMVSRNKQSAGAAGK